MEPTHACCSGPAAESSSWTGKVEKLGPSVYMQGSHRLVQADGTVLLLASAKLDLSKYEGKTVTVSGRASPTVEGHQTIVDVEAVKEAP